MLKIGVCVGFLYWNECVLVIEIYIIEVYIKLDW